MVAQEDFRELLALFNSNGVDYVIVGAHAIAFYGSPRLTGDLDLLVRADSDNARSILTALAEFGLGLMDLKSEDFTTPDRVIQLGVAPIRIDLLTSLTGVSWEEVAAGRVAGKYGDVPVSFIGKTELVANKRALGRSKDRADIEALGLE